MNLLVAGFRLDKKEKILIRKALTLHYRLLLLHYRRYTYSCSAAIVAYWPHFGRPRASDVGER